MRTSNFHRIGLGLPLALWVTGCGGEDGGPGSIACTVTTPYVIGSAVPGELSTDDCTLIIDGTYIDLYRFEVTSQISAEFALSSTTIDAFLWMFATGSPGGQTLALHDDVDATNTDAVLHILMSPDSYVVGANSPPPPETGAYTLSSGIVDANNTDCAEVWVTPAVTTTQALATTDCATANPYSDEFGIVLAFGQTLTVTMTSGEVSPRLLLLDSGRTVETQDPGGTNATISFTAAESDVYIIVATSDTPNETGAYTLTVEVGI